MLKCKTCSHEISEYQFKEYNGCCCGVCENKHPRANCANCGLPLTDDDIERYGYFCSGGCAGEFGE